jgi:hypothetical protein
VVDVLTLHLNSDLETFCLSPTDLMIDDLQLTTFGKLNGNDRHHHDNNNNQSDDHHVRAWLR